jgi:hypothetical protein
MVWDKDSKTLKRSVNRDPYVQDAVANTDKTKSSGRQNSEGDSLILQARRAYAPGRPLPSNLSPPSFPPTPSVPPKSKGFLAQFIDKVKESGQPPTEKWLRERK